MAEPRTTRTSSDGHPHETHDHPHAAAHDHPHEDHAHPHGDEPHGHPHPHDDAHDHSHGGEGGHDHEHRGGLVGAFKSIFSPHSHDAGDKVDDALTASKEGMRALKISLGILALTAVFQVVIVVISGSVALLADTVHNFSDALTAIPIGIAFVLGRRLANRRYTYGYGRA